MKKHLSSLYLLTGLCAPALAQQGASLPPSLLGLQRDDLGCKVLLCLSNPNGPTAVSQCRPPMERLKWELAHGRPFPSCAMASGPNGASYAKPGYSPYDDCPQGTTSADLGQTVTLAAPMPATAIPASYRSGAATGYTQASTGYGYVGIGGGSAQTAVTPDSGPLPAKICVAGARGTRTIGPWDDPRQVSLYDTIYVQQPQRSPSFIDVYIDNAIWQRVRW